MASMSAGRLGCAVVAMVAIVNYFVASVNHCAGNAGAARVSIVHALPGGSGAAARARVPAAVAPAAAAAGAVPVTIGMLALYPTPDSFDGAGQLTEDRRL